MGSLPVKETANRLEAESKLRGPLESWAESAAIISPRRRSAWENEFKASAQKGYKPFCPGNYCNPNFQSYLGN